ncbi:MAG: carbohydrate kinase family protein, partial [Gelidibacter sp.]
MDKKQFEVITVGELNVDLILNNIEGYPEIGKEKMAKKMTLTLGSSSAIFASNLSSLGARVSFLGKIGNDVFGELVKNSLSEKGVDISNLIHEPELQTGVTVVLNYDEDRANVTYGGAMDALTLNDVSDEILGSARHMHFASLFLQTGLKSDVIALFKRAKEMGLTTSLDTQWDPEEKWEFDYQNLLPYVDLFMPNATEFMLLTKSKSIKEAAEKVKDYCNHVVIKNGSKGSILIKKDGNQANLPNFLNTNVVDAIGAGDSFN